MPQAYSMLYASFVPILKPLSHLVQFFTILYYSCLIMSLMSLSQINFTLNSFVLGRIESIFGMEVLLDNKHQPHATYLVPMVIRLKWQPQ